MKRNLLFTLSTLIVVTLGLAVTGIAAAKGSFHTGQNVAIVQAPIVDGKSSGLDDSLPTLEASPDDNDMEPTQTPMAENPDDSNKPGETEFSGTVLSIVGDTWTIDSQSVLVSTETELKGTFAVGDQVKVEAFVNADGILTAREIQKLDEGSDSGHSSSGDNSGKGPDNGSNNGLASPTSGSEDGSGKSGGNNDDGGGDH
jgi:hypothetical protein